MPQTIDCPVCSHLANQTSEYGDTRDGAEYGCSNCGQFFISRTAMRKLETLNKDERAILSMMIWEMQDGQEEHREAPTIGTPLLNTIKDRQLPNPSEQLDSLLVYLAEKQRTPGRPVMRPLIQPAKIGAMLREDVDYILQEALNSELIEVWKDSSGASQQYRLTLRGWQRYEELRRGATHSRTAFMAMPFGDDNVCSVVDNVFRPAVEAAGFKLKRVDDNPKAGLIDDKLRVDIRMCRFLIAELTHGNQGAYWEAGYAEGLGKPVIYTCAKSYWDKHKTHFDTNHCYTVVWDRNDLTTAGEKLTAAIRNTLPTEARMPEE